MLERDGNEDLAKRVAKGKLEEGDIVFLEERRKIFSEKITQSEKVEKILTKENIIDLARNNPDFEKILNLVGPEKALKAIQSQLKDISITDESRFNSILSAIEAQESYKNGEYKETNDCVEKFLKDNKISSKEYLTALAIEDPLEKEEALRRLASKVPGRREKFINFFTGGTEGKFNPNILADLQSSETSLEDSILKLNSLQTDIGSILSSTLGGNDSMRNALFGELTNDKAPEVPKSGFKEAKKEAFDEVSFNEHWNSEKEATDFDRKTPAEQNVIKDSFINRAQKYHKEQSEGKGFWHTILASITEALINSKKAELK